MMTSPLSSWTKPKVIGFAAGRIPSLPINLTLVKGFSLVGVRSGAQLVQKKKKKEKQKEISQKFQRSSK